jgi:hypothetical protein
MSSKGKNTYGFLKAQNQSANLRQSSRILEKIGAD